MMCHAKLRKAGGALRVAGARGMVEEALAMTSVDKIIDLYSTATEAARISTSYRNWRAPTEFRYSGNYDSLIHPSSC